MVKKRFLPAKRDALFKALFGDQKNKRILAGFLSSVIDLKDDEFESLQIMDPQIKRLPSDKGCIFDVYAKTAKGNTFEVEVQLEKVSAVKKRVAYYNSMMFSSQINRGEDYAKLQKAISIIITDFNWIDSPNCANKFTLYDKDSRCEFTDIISICTLELPKLPDNTDELLYNWLKLINASSAEELEPLKSKDALLREAVDMLLELNEDEKIRMQAEYEEKVRRDNVARDTYLRDEGIAEGKREDAHNLLALGVSIDIIQQATGLTLAEINGLG